MTDSTRPVADDQDGRLNLFIDRLRAAHHLTPRTIAAIHDVGTSDRVFRQRQMIVCEGDPVQGLMVVTEGWAARYKLLANGRRQIIGFCLPGDLCDSNVLVDHDFDYSIVALTRVRIVTIPAEECRALAGRQPAIGSALIGMTLADLALQREWTTAIGKRTASERVARLFCELYLRLRAVGWVQGDTCILPLTQQDIGDATGLTAIHINRVLRELREAEMLDLNNRELVIVDWEALVRSADFDPSYLRLAA